MIAENFCLHSMKYTLITLDDSKYKEYKWECVKCGKNGITSEGWTRYCPNCKKDCKTTCIVCGCGSCLECGYRYNCRPVDIGNIAVDYKLTLKKSLFKETSLWEN